MLIMLILFLLLILLTFQNLPLHQPIYSTDADSAYDASHSIKNVNTYSLLSSCLPHTQTQPQYPSIYTSIHYLFIYLSIYLLYISLTIYILSPTLFCSIYYRLHSRMRGLDSNHERGKGWMKAARYLPLPTPGSKYHDERWNIHPPSNFISRLQYQL